MGHERVDIARRIWSVDSLQIPFRGKDQDGMAVGKGSVAVVDGATPLDPSWPQDVGLFAREAARCLVEAADTCAPGGDGRDIWSRTVKALAEHFPPQGHRRTASAGIVFGRGELLCVSSLGDVCTLVQTSTGPVRVIDNRLVLLDQEAAQESDVHTRLVANRALANHPNGYPILGDDPTVGAVAQTVEIEATDVRNVWIMSDGFWRNLPDDPIVAVEHLLAAEAGSLATLVSAAPTDDVTTVRLRPVKTS